MGEKRERCLGVTSFLAMANWNASTKSDAGPKYDVFLNFRGEDTRHNFTDFLYDRLIDAGVHTFRDEEKLPIGDVISDRLERAINNSTLYIPIFSWNYASSKWCLRELKLIMDNVSNSGGQRSIFPIFLLVKPDDVKLKTRPDGEAPYKAAFEEHKKNFPDEVEAWKTALEKVDERKGLVVEKNTSQAVIVKSVVKRVLKKLEIKQKFLTDEPVGRNHQVHELTLLLSANHLKDPNRLDVRLIVIYGMGGIGKTTVAKVVFNELSSNFGKRCSFLENIRKSSSTEEGLVKLQKQLLSEIVDSESIDIMNSEQGMRKIGETLPTDTIMVVLDDVDDKEHIKKLIGNSPLKEGSRIMITTRNSTLLQAEDFNGKILEYEMQELDNAFALQLFCRHAFDRDSPTHEYHWLSSKIVSHMGGLPLAIKVIGSLLKGQGEKIWIETLAKLGNVLEKEIMKTLRISYDDLAEQQQQIFLDIACFFVNKKKTDAMYMWDHCQFYPESGIQVLKSRCLIKILDDDKFWMHDQLIDLGREIVRQESPSDHAKRSRFWIAKEALKIIRTEEWKNRVQALEIDGWDHSIEIADEELKRLQNLRYLKLGNGTFIGDFAKCCSNLKWISWCSPQQDIRAKNMYLDHLVVFKLDRNDFMNDSKAWDLIKRAHNLKVVSLTRCDGITTIPDVSKSLGLERLTLARCNRLKSIKSFIGNLQSLIELDIEGCMKFTDLSEKVGELRKLMHFSLQGCCMLSELPSSLGNLTSLIELDLSSTSITRCNLSWIVRLSGLKKLDLNLPNLPKLQDLALLSHLEEVTVSEEYVKFLKLPPSLTYLQIKAIHPSFKTEGGEKATASRENIRESEESRSEETKLVVRVDWSNGREARKAMQIVSRLEGISSISSDVSNKKLTVIGHIDPVMIVSKLRKQYLAEIVSIGSVREREVVLQVRWHDEKDMKKAVDTIFGFAGVDTVFITMKDQKLRVTGSINVRKLVEKLEEKTFSVRVA